jgi:hypothetical protein
MKPTFTIKQRGAQSLRSTPFDEILTDKILADMSKCITGSVDYDVNWLPEMNVGRLVKFETNDAIYFITLSPYGSVVSRNSYFQSVPTAYRIFLQEQAKAEKECVFCFYFLPCKGNNKTDYMCFMYEILTTIGVRFINREYGLRLYKPTAFTSVRDIIRKRNTNSGQNSANQSTYLTEEGKFYHIYGKTFGANQKETTLMCMAICKVADKPVRLFQIIDNDSTNLSENDIRAIQMFSVNNNTKSIDILDDSYDFEDFEDDVVVSQPAPEENLRHPRFIYNLLEKTHGVKKCTLCQCNIESLIQGAHIYPVKNIKQMQGVSYKEKLLLATDKDNSLWLCENHHKLFDSGQIYFVDGEVEFSSSLDESEKNYLNEITTQRRISKELYTPRLKHFMHMRDEVYQTKY